MRARAVIIVAALGALLGAAPAGAATPFVAFEGRQQDLAMDAAGNAHLVHLGGSPGQVRYCRADRGATACGAAREVGMTGAVGGPYVLAAAPSTIHVYSHLSQGRLATSTDGGGTFGPVRVVSDPQPASPLPSGTSQAILGPGDAISTISGGGNFQHHPLTGPAPTTWAMLKPQDPVVGSADLALDGGTLVALLQGASSGSSSSEGTSIRRHSGTGNPNDVATWGPPVPLTTTPLTEREGFVGGPGGVFLMETQRLGTESAIGSRTTVRRIGAAGAGAPVELGTDLQRPEIHQDPAGNLHVVYGADVDQPDDTKAFELHWRTSTDGVTWSAPVPVYRGTRPAAGFSRDGLAMTADGHGWAMFGVQNGSTAPVTLLELGPVGGGAGPGGPVVPGVTPGGGGGPADRTAPVLSGLTIPATFRLGTALTPVQLRLAPRGATIRFTLSEPAEVRLKFLRLVPGLRLDAAGCTPRTATNVAKLRARLARTAAIRRLKGKARTAALARALAKRACGAVDRAFTSRSISRDAVAGANAVPFSGRIRGQAAGTTVLKPGRYRVVAEPRDAARNRGKASFRDFTLAKG
ncbi:hypothetical protein DSM112329_05455 [Paraconexibacter sp. AEG42_29]|uniref:Exo-alpha-sialidase n=1 Tax=Paraconexibacter sp. AEG42_29 TaxID=2997339 RepID=A0AAU7B3U1_9ACTN